MCVSSLLTTDGYYFSDQPFHNTDQIEAVQLAIMLGCANADTAETILEAYPKTEESPYQLLLIGCPEVTDAQRRPVPIEHLRELPVEELADNRLKAKGWHLCQAPHFQWIKDKHPISGGRSSTIASCAQDQVNALRNLL